MLLVMFAWTGSLYWFQSSSRHSIVTSTLHLYMRSYLFSENRLNQLIKTYNNDIIDIICKTSINLVYYLSIFSICTIFILFCFLLHVFQVNVLKRQHEQWRNINNELLQIQDGCKKLSTINRNTAYFQIATIFVLLFCTFILLFWHLKRSIFLYSGY